MSDLSPGAVYSRFLDIQARLAERECVQLSHADRKVSGAAEKGGPATRQRISISLI
jgi:hypothetical protein